MSLSTKWSFLFLKHGCDTEILYLEIGELRFDLSQIIANKSFGRDHVVIDHWLLIYKTLIKRVDDTEILDIWMPVLL